MLVFGSEQEEKREFEKRREVQKPRSHAKPVSEQPQRRRQENGNRGVLGYSYPWEKSRNIGRGGHHSEYGTCCSREGEACMLLSLLCPVEEDERKLICSDSPLLHFNFKKVSLQWEFWNPTHAASSVEERNRQCKGCRSHGCGDVAKGPSINEHVFGSPLDAFMHPSSHCLVVNPVRSLQTTHDEHSILNCSEHEVISETQGYVSASRPMLEREREAGAFVGGGGGGRAPGAGGGGGGGPLRPAASSKQQAASSKQQAASSKSKSKSKRERERQRYDSPGGTVCEFQPVLRIRRTAKCCSLYLLLLDVFAYPP